MFEYLEPFNNVQAIVMLVCKQISLDTFKGRITYKPLTYKQDYLQTIDLQIICITIQPYAIK